MRTPPDRGDDPGVNSWRPEAPKPRVRGNIAAVRPRSARGRHAGRIEPVAESSSPEETDPLRLAQPVGSAAARFDMLREVGEPRVLVGETARLCARLSRDYRAGLGLPGY